MYACGIIIDPTRLRSDKLYFLRKHQYFLFCTYLLVIHVTTPGPVLRGGTGGQLPGGGLFWGRQNYLR